MNYTYEETEAEAIANTEGISKAVDRICTTAEVIVKLILERVDRQELRAIERAQRELERAETHSRVVVETIENRFNEIDEELQKLRQQMPRD